MSKNSLLLGVFRSDFDVEVDKTHWDLLIS